MYRRWRSMTLLLIMAFRLCRTTDECESRDQCANVSDRSPSIYNDETSIRSRNCFCDTHCEQYGDCCQSSSRSTGFECVDYLAPTFNNKMLPFHRLSAWMRTQCLPIYFGSAVDRLCRNVDNRTFDDHPFLFVPATSPSTNITYRNYYCAYCNNDDHDRIQLWKYKPFCHGDGTDDDHLSLTSDVQVQYYIHNLTRNCPTTIVYPHGRATLDPSVFVRPCKRSMAATCPRGTPTELARLCATSGVTYRYVPDSDVIYPNAFCAQCNEDNASELTCVDPYLRSSLPPLNHIRVHPLSILFDPTLLRRYLNVNNTMPHVIFSIKHNCTKPDELFDVFEKRCAPTTNADDEFILSLNCSRPMRTLVESADQHFADNGSLYLANMSLLLTREEFAFVNERRIVFCADRWSTANASSVGSITFDISRQVLAVVCTTTSLVCLFVFSSMFVCVPSLHNLPGQCLLCLSVSLFVGQLTFLVSSRLAVGSSTCIASAIVIHYFYLSSFVWLTIISIQIHSTFRRQTVHRESVDKTRRLLFGYNIVVVCSTGIVVLIACLLQLVRPGSSLSPAYGAIFCSMSSSNAVIVFFLVPIGCLLSTVTILFVRTLVAVDRSRSTGKLATITSASHVRPTRLVFVYARLASLMGIQWILLIVALAIGHSWTWLLFEIVNSLPGLFICFGFLCSKRLLDNVRHQIVTTILTRQHSSPSNATSTTFM
jgi:G protein-coupled receptor Mth (Methuselah protein)